MLQIVIWGMAIMLLVKGLDVLHQQRIAVDGGHQGAPSLALAAIGIAIVGAVFLIWASGNQAETVGGLPSLTRYDNRGAALRAWDNASPELKARVLSETSERSRGASGNGELTQAMDDTN